MLEDNTIKIAKEIINNLEWNNLSTILIRGVVKVEIMDSHIEEALVLIPQFL